MQNYAKMQNVSYCYKYEAIGAGNMHVTFCVNISQQGIAELSQNNVKKAVILLIK